MNFLAFTGNLKSKNASTVGSRIERLSSSDEYEESDVETPDEIFIVKKIVKHMKLIKGRVYQQAHNAGPYTFNVDALEKSKFGYAFKVRWLNYEEKDDTWEPIENFNLTLTKKIRKYCKRHSIELPENFRDWLIHASDEGSSGSDDTKSNHSSGSSKKKVRSPSPQPSGSRAVNEKKNDRKSRINLLKDDLFLSPSPSPMQPAKNKNKFDPLFDSSDDERKKTKKEEDMDSKKLSDPMRVSPLRLKIPRVAPIDNDQSPSPLTVKRTPTAVKKTVKRDESIDIEETPRKKIPLKKKPEERKRKNSFVSKSDGNDSEKEEGDLVKKKIVKLPKRGTPVGKGAFKGTPTAVKKNKRDGSIDKDKSQSTAKGTPTAVKKNKRDGSIDTEETSRVDKEVKREKEKKQSKIDKEKPKPAESKKTSKGLVPTRDVSVDASSDTPKMSHFELEAKKKKKKLEKKMKEKVEVIPKKEDGHKKMDDQKKDGLKKEEKREVKKEKVEKKEVKKEKEEKVELKKKIEPTSSRGSRKRMKREEKGEEKPAAPEPTRIEKAKKRLEIINKRLNEFASAARRKEIDQEEKWEKEEDMWRRKMYESGRWIKIGTINDVPFSFRAEQGETDTKLVRTLRRCASAERLPVSFRRLSSLLSMNYLPSQADSLAEALLEMNIGEKAVRLRQLRKHFEEKKRKEKREKINVFKEAKSILDLQEKTESFIKETQSIMDRFNPGETSEEANRKNSNRIIYAFLSLDHAALIQVLETKLKSADCITQVVLALARIFSPIVNVAEADEGLRSVCDEGEHRKCRMLLTLLMSLAESCRMGDDDSSLLPANTLYDAMEVSAPCQLRALIRGGCTFDGYFDDDGKNAAHRMMEKYSMIELIWLIERGLDVNSAILPKRNKDLENEFYGKPWKMIKESKNTKSAFISQIHSQRLTARSVVWTKRVKGVDFNLRPLTLVHTLNPHAHFTRFAAVTLCDVERKGFDHEDAVLLAVHSATVRKGKGLRIPVRTNKKKKTPQLRVPYFLIDQASDDPTFNEQETYQCVWARLTIHNLSTPSRHDTVELTRMGSNGPTTVFKVPKKQAQMLVSGRRFTECQLQLVSPPEYSVILAQYFIVPFKNAQGKFTDLA